MASFFTQTKYSRYNVNRFMKFSKFFSKIQETPWYRSFLNPVINEITTEGKLLDIGTGSGKLIQILSDEKIIHCIGVDTNQEMLNEAQKKLKGTNTSLLKIKANTKLPFNDNSFSYVTICSVLFHLKKEEIDFILNDIQRILEKNGKIIVLTPTGKGSFYKLTKKYFSLKNTSVYIWFYATQKRAKLWTNNNYLKKYAYINNLKYNSKTVMNGFSQLEIINK